MAAKKEGDGDKRPIVIKKIKKGGGGHHGGAWKVAYADFVTAMMAFFLLLWLLNVTTEEQKLGISDYFNPTPQVSTQTSGAGGILGGMSMSPEGNRASDATPLPSPIKSQTPPKGQKVTEQDLKKVEKEKLAKEVKRREEDNFKKTKEKIEKMMAENPELQALQKNIVVDMTPEGLRIQIVDQEGDAMFPSGSSAMYDKTKKLMSMVTGVIRDMNNQVSIRGHTDGAPYHGAGGRSNWELSSERANASRTALVESGLPEKRIANVVGKADTDHFIADKPLDARNRRISIILLHDYLTHQPGANSVSGDGADGEGGADDPGYQKTPGAVQFP